MIAAAGVQAVVRRAAEGDSHGVTVTLAQASTFEMSLGLNAKAQLMDIDELGPEHQIARPNL